MFYAQFGQTCWDGGEGLPTSTHCFRSKVQDVSSKSKPAVTKSPAGKKQPIKKHLLGMQQPMPAARVTTAAAVPAAVALPDTLHMKGRAVISLFLGFSYQSVDICVFSGATVFQHTCAGKTNFRSDPSGVKLRSAHC